MFQNIRDLSIFNKVFNLYGNEYPKLLISWVIRFLYRTSFVIGWTVIVGMFVANYGISTLPYLFAANALFTILGSLFYSTFIDRYAKDTLMVITVLVTVCILFLGILLEPVDKILFFALLLAVESIFLMQFKVLLDGYIEEMFNPLESERVFPLIEAAETFGGIIAGLTVVYFSGSIDTYKLIYLCMGILLLIVPCLFIYKSLKEHVVIVKKEVHKEEEIGIFSKFKNEFLKSKDFSFIKGLFFIIILQWILFNLIEFQYTRAVYSNVSHIILEGGSGFEHAIVHDLGVLFIIFNSSILIMQIFIGGRLLNALGITGTIILHPVVTILSLLGLIIMPGNFNMAVLTKNNFGVTSAIFTNAYHSSYYAIKESLREHTREFLEGIVRPIGALIGTLVLILLQVYLQNNDLTFYLNIAMLIFALLLLQFSYIQQRKYTENATHHLLSNEKEMRVNAVDILAQKGHKDPSLILTKILLNDSEPISLRVRILRALGELKEEVAIKEIIKCFNASKAAIREAAIDALFSYKDLFDTSNKKLTVLRYQLVNELKNMYEREVHEDLRSRIVLLLSNISSVSTIEFLLKILHESKGTLREDSIYALGNYDDECVVDYIKPYLKSRNFKEKINAAIALAKFDNYYNEAIYTVSSFIYGNSKEKIAYGLYAIGELNLTRMKDICVKYLNSKDLNLKMYAAVALAKMGNDIAIPRLIDLLFSKNQNVAKKVKNFLKNIDVRIFKNVDRILKHLVAEEIKKLLNKNKAEILTDLAHEDLLTLRWLYSLIGEYDEVEIIDSLIKK